MHIILCEFKYKFNIVFTVYPLFGVLVSIHEGKKIMYYFYTSICKNVFQYVPVKNCLAEYIFWQVHTTLTCSVQWRKNIWVIEIFSIRSLRGVISRECSNLGTFWDIFFTDISVCQHINLCDGHISHNYLYSIFLNLLRSHLLSFELTLFTMGRGRDKFCLRYETLCYEL